MKRKLKNKPKSQSTLEFTIVVFCFITALVVMSVYMKRGIQGKIRQTADGIGTAYAPGATTGTSSQVLNRTSRVQVYTQLGTANVTGGGTVDGQYTYSREDILSETIQENATETVR